MEADRTGVRVIVIDLVANGKRMQFSISH